MSYLFLQLYLHSAHLSHSLLVLTGELLETLQRFFWLWITLNSFHTGHRLVMMLLNYFSPLKHIFTDCNGCCLHFDGSCQLFNQHLFLEWWSKRKNVFWATGEFFVAIPKMTTGKPWKPHLIATSFFFFFLASCIFCCFFIFVLATLGTTELVTLLDPSTPISKSSVVGLVILGMCNLLQSAFYYCSIQSH